MECSRSLKDSPGEVNRVGNIEERRGRKSFDKLKGKLSDGDLYLLGHISHHSPVNEVPNQVSEEMNHNIESLLKEVNHSLTASKQLVKVLYRLIFQEEQQSSSRTLVSALRVELDRARLQIDQLVHEQQYNSKQLDVLWKQFSEERIAWKRKEKQKIRDAISSLAKEVEFEKKFRRQAERLNRKLGIELADTKHELSRIMNELDEERRTKERLEKACDKLASGFKEERVKRVQRRSMPEIFLKEYGQAPPYFEGIEDINGFFKTMKVGSSEDQERVQEESNSEDTEDSFELSMDDDNKSYKRRFAGEGSNQEHSRRNSLEEILSKGRRSLFGGIESNELEQELREACRAILEDVALRREQLEGIYVGSVS